MTIKKLLIDDENIGNIGTLHLQEEKIKLASLLQDFEEIKVPASYEVIAYQIAIQEIFESFSLHLELVSEVLEHITPFVKEKKYYPVIQQRINAIMDAVDQDMPNLSTEERAIAEASLFKPGSEFDGLYKMVDEKEVVDEEWLNNYINKCDKEDLPRTMRNIPFTDEMLVDLGKIEAMDITEEEKENKVDELFMTGGKYTGFFDLVLGRRIMEYNEYNRNQK